MSYAGLRGVEIDFSLGEGPSRRVFRGTVGGDSMQGTVESGGGKTARWTAKRT
jgi:hypothetical protein